MTERPTARLDVEKLAWAIATVVRYRRISARQAAEEIGVSDSTLSRLKQGKSPDADALLSMLAWLGADASHFTIRRC